MTNILAENARAIFKFTEHREKLAAEYIATVTTNSEVLKNDILKFSKFLTWKGVSRWTDITADVVRSFLIIAEHEDDEAFDATSWINSLKLFFDYLVANAVIEKNIFEVEKSLLEEDLIERLSPEKKCVRCGVVIERNHLAKYCGDCSKKVQKERTVEWGKNHPDKIKQFAKAWNDRNKDRLREFNRKWREKNREKVKGYALKHRQKNAAKENSPTDEEYHTIADLANAIGYSRQGIYLLIKQGKISVTVVAGRSLISNSEYQKIIQMAKSKGKFRTFPRG